MTPAFMKFHAERGRGSKSGTQFALEERQRKRERSGRTPNPGYPMEGRFTPPEALDYLDRDPLPCLLCGRDLQHLGRHLSMIHDMTSRAYCERYGLPFHVGSFVGLTTKRLHRKLSETVRAVPGMKDRMRELHKKIDPASYLVRHPTVDHVSAELRLMDAKTYPRPCERCGKTFRPFRSGGRFCGHSCAGKARWDGRRAPRKYCADCRNELPAGSQANGVTRCSGCHKGAMKAQRLTTEERKRRKRAAYHKNRSDPVWSEKGRSRRRKRSEP